MALHEADEDRGDGGIELAAGLVELLGEPIGALVLALALYTLGNLMMVRLMRESGMSVAISVSAVLQLLLANAMAFGLFGERPSMQQLAGIGLGVVSVMLIVMPSAGPK